MRLFWAMLAGGSLARSAARFAVENFAKRGFEFLLLSRVPAAQCMQAESTPTRRYPLRGRCRKPLGGLQTRRLPNNQ